MACTRQPAADNGHTALAWFALQTARLEHLRALEETIIADLMVAVMSGFSRRGSSAILAMNWRTALAHYPDKPTRQKEKPARAPLPKLASPFALVIVSE